jgi:hypothetical protein
MTATGNQTVDDFLDALDHPLKAEIVAVREMILASNPRVTERIKWKAPSFGYDGEDRVTFKLHPSTALTLVFHRGAKVKDASDFSFTDPSGLLQWVAKDRATVTLRNMAEVEEHGAALIATINAWMDATT